MGRQFWMSMLAAAIVLFGAGRSTATEVQAQTGCRQPASPPCQIAPGTTLCPIVAGASPFHKFALRLPQGRAATVRLGGLANDYDLYVYTADGSFVGGSQHEEAEEESVFVPAPTQERAYQVWVAANPSRGPTIDSTYDLSIIDEPALSVGTAVRPFSFAAVPGTGAPISIGSPNANGWEAKGRVTSTRDVARYAFTIPRGHEGSISIYVGEKNFDASVALARDVSGLIGGQDLVLLSLANQPEPPFIEQTRPRFLTIPWAEKGDYFVSVWYENYGGPGSINDMPISGDFTIRIAVSPPLCALTPPPDRLHPAMSDASLSSTERSQFAGVRLRPTDPQYQLGMTAAPEAPAVSQFSLMTFTAVLSPQFTDLFDFTWAIDGQPIPDAHGADLQMPASKIPGEHFISVTAQGVRQYMSPISPRFNHVPLDGGSLTATCPVRVPA